MRVRRHRSFRPTLDVLPGRIAPSNSGLAAVAASPISASSNDLAYYPLTVDYTSESLATQTVPVDPA